MTQTQGSSQLFPNDEEMTALLLDLGYTAEESKAWRESGFLAFDMDVVKTQILHSVISSEPIDLLAFEWDIKNYIRTAPARHRNRVLLDIYTGSILTPPLFAPAAIWGTEEVIANPFPTRQKIIRTTRARFNTIPYYLADSYQEYLDLASHFKTASEEEQRQVLFRGQTSEYVIHRYPEVTRFLFGDESKKEASLVTAAFRKSFDFAAFEPYIRNLLFDIELRLGGSECRSYRVEGRYEELCISPEQLIGKGNSVGVAAVAQHYGIPTYGLDTTRSPEVALWFATHAFVPNSDGLVVYCPHVWDSLEDEKWPIVYVLLSSHYIVLQELEIPECKRPIAQDAAFVFGGWGPHGNVCAADVIAAIVLSPNVGVVHSPTDRVFPRPETDRMYRELLALRNASEGNPEFRARTGLDSVFEIDYQRCVD